MNKFIFRMIMMLTYTFDQTSVSIILYRHYNVMFYRKQHTLIISGSCQYQSNDISHSQSSYQIISCFTHYSDELIPLIFLFYTIHVVIKLLEFHSTIVCVTTHIFVLSQVCQCTPATIV